MRVRWPNQLTHETGQSLVEFAFGAILLFVILAAGFYVGQAMLMGNMASEGIREPTMRKWEMANTPGAIGDSTIMGWATDIDNVNFVSTGPSDVTSIIVGEKTTNTNFMGMPNFTFTVTQGIQKNLLKAVAAPNHGTNWFPNTFHGHPFDFMNDNRHQQLPGLEYVGGCADRTAIGGEAVIQFLAGGDSAPYVSRSPAAYNSPFKLVSFLQLAKTFEPECPEPNAAAKCNEARSLLTFKETVEPSPNPWPECQRGVTCGGDDEDLCPKVPTGKLVCYNIAEEREYAATSCVGEGVIDQGPEMRTECPPDSQIDDHSGESDCEPREAGACILANPQECQATGGRMLTITLENPPGAAGLRFTMQKVPCQTITAQVSEISGFHDDLELGTYHQPGYEPRPGQGPPPGFVEACMKRKKAECMLRKAYERSRALLEEFNEASGECRLL